jgi:DNA-binding NarL/FixJ family response regulator
MNHPIKLLLADDHELFRDGFSLMFKKNKKIKLVGQARDGKELIEIAHALQPDVIVTDIQMPVMGGIEATKLLTEQLPAIGIIALAMFNEEDQLMEMLEAGARGYLIKNADKKEIIAAIETVYEGRKYYCEDTSRKLAKINADSDSKRVTRNPMLLFSEKERAIIKMICDERSTKQIAFEMHLGCRTVEWYRDGILQKTGAKNVAGIVVYAIEHKLYSSKA